MAGRLWHYSIAGGSAPACCCSTRCIQHIQKKINVQDYFIYVLAERANKLGLFYLDTGGAGKEIGQTCNYFM